MFGRQALSNTDMAASEPEPIVTYGSLSVEPWGAIVKSCGPVLSKPPSTSAAPMWPWYWNKRCFSNVMAVTTRGRLRV